MLHTITSEEAGLAHLLSVHSDHILRVTEFISSGETACAQAESVYIEPLGDERFELLLSSEEVTESIVNGVRVRQSESLCYFEIAQDDSGDLANTAKSVYQIVFKVAMEMTGFQLLRIWNYIPNILEGNDEQESYRQFNRGRFTAWHESGPLDTNGRPVYPAATGIGAWGGPLVVQVLMAKGPVQHVQNYRQIPAPNYSQKFGKRPPSFARASLLGTQNNAQLIVSGTASVVGEETVHTTASAQMRETLRNLQALLSGRNLNNQAAFRLEELHSIRVYVKDPSDLPAIQRELSSKTSGKVIYLKDDICRPGLLLEVEGIAGGVHTKASP